MVATSPKSKNSINHSARMECGWDIIYIAVAHLWVINEFVLWLHCFDFGIEKSFGMGCAFLSIVILLSWHSPKWLWAQSQQDLSIFAFFTFGTVWAKRTGINARNMKNATNTRIKRNTKSHFEGPRNTQFKLRLIVRWEYECWGRHGGKQHFVITFVALIAYLFVHYFTGPFDFDRTLLIGYCWSRSIRINKSKEVTIYSPFCVGFYENFDSLYSLEMRWITN